MKNRSKLFLTLITLVAIGLGALSYFGIGSSHLFGVKNIKQGLDLQGGVSIVYEADVENPSSDDMNSAISLLRHRLDRKNYTEAQVAKQGSNRIRVEIPGIAEADARNAEEEARRLEEEQANAQAGSDNEVTDENTESETSEETTDETAADGSTDETAVESADESTDETAEEPVEQKSSSIAAIIGQTAMLYFVDEAGNVVLTGNEVANATRVLSGGNTGASEIVVALEFTSQGAAYFEEATGNNIGKKIYILLDDEIISAPTVNDKISGGRATITGSFTADEAEELATLIREGSLPFALKVISENSVGATLGADALKTSIIAGIVGALFVLVFMIAVYRVAGLAADLALLIYIELVLILLSLFGLTLTLPGIAGIILSIGMAVDANIVIFERLKEEVAAGKSTRAAIDAAFKRAFPPILDSNVTTIISAIILLWLGTGPIKGFAQTLGIGVLMSMFSALIITRFIMKNIALAGVTNPKTFVNVTSASAAGQKGGL